MTRDAGKHTPLPWAATTRQGSWDWVIYSANFPHLEICQPFHDDTEENPTGEANAALIVRAVNAHEGLVKALKEIVSAFDCGALQMSSPDVGGHDDIPAHPWHEEWLYLARSALKLSEGAE
jgi:hypothetical protein